jgi:Yip1 domain
MLGAARLEGETFRELRDDPSATLQSLFVVAIVGHCYGTGLGLFQFFVAGTSPSEFLIIALIGLLSAVVIAAVWSGVTFLIATKLFRASVSYWGLSRPFFFSWAPGLLLILMLSPILAVSEIIRVVGAVWIIVASVFAVKQAAGVSIQQSMLTFIIGVLVLIVIQSLFSVI